MNFLLVVSLIIVVALLFKSYMLRGVWQALRSPIWTIAYATISIGSMLLGIITAMHAFSDGMIDLSLTENFTIAFMISILCCELFLLIFFLLDDVFTIGIFFQKSIYKKEIVDTLDHK